MTKTKAIVILCILSLSAFLIIPLSTVHASSPVYIAHYNFTTSGSSLSVSMGSPSAGDYYAFMFYSEPYQIDATSAEPIGDTHSNATWWNTAIVAGWHIVYGEGIVTQSGSDNLIATFLASEGTIVGTVVIASGTEMNYPVCTAWGGAGSGGASNGAKTSTTCPVPSDAFIMQFEQAAGSGTPTVGMSLFYSPVNPTGGAFGCGGGWTADCSGVPYYPLPSNFPFSAYSNSNQWANVIMVFGSSSTTTTTTITQTTLTAPGPNTFDYWMIPLIFILLPAGLFLGLAQLTKMTGKWALIMFLLGCTFGALIGVLASVVPAGVLVIFIILIAVIFWRF